jgi:hypothetical protein
MKIVCYKCQAVTQLIDARVGRRDECASCHQDLRVCLNCEFYDVSRRYECREDITERVADKDKATFCDHFRPRSSLDSEQPATDPKTEALRRAEALFKKK